MAHEKLLAWVDTETTGLDPNKNRILEIAVEVTDSDLNVIESLEAKIKLSPEDLAAAAPRALEVNGYNEKEWENAVVSDVNLWRKIAAMTSKRILAGQNITQFDAPFIAAEMARFGIKPSWDRRMLDTMSDCIRAMYEFDVRHPNGGYATAGLEFVYPVLDGPPLPPHRAMADVKRAQFVHKIFDAGFKMELRARTAREMSRMAAEKAAIIHSIPPVTEDLPYVEEMTRRALHVEGVGFDANGSDVTRPQDAK